MHTPQRLPDIAALVEPLIKHGLPYEHFQLPGPSDTPNACWGLVHYLLHAGFGIDLATDPMSAGERAAELWFRGDARDPCALVQPWDVLLLATRSLISDHVGLIVEPTRMVHVNKQHKVCLMRSLWWKPRLVQILRLRMLW